MSRVLPLARLGAGLVLLPVMGSALAQHAGHHQHRSPAPTPPAASAGTTDAHPGHHGHGGHGATTPPAVDHAAMGHHPPAPAAAEPATPIPVPTDAERAAAFPVLRAPMQHGGQVNSFLLFDRLEGWDAAHGSAQAWELQGWIGTDLDRVWVRSAGEREDDRTAAAEVEVLYARSVSPWWDVVAGVRHGFQPQPETWAAIGMQGLAPYLFETRATLYLGGSGRVEAEVEAEYELLLTNRLILQPAVELTFAADHDRARRVGSGLSTAEAGVRMRYEVTRRFAPYIGVVHERAFGRTADFRTDAGGHARDTRVVAGLRLWF